MSHLASLGQVVGHNFCTLFLHVEAEKPTGSAYLENTLAFEVDLAEVIVLIATKIEQTFHETTPGKIHCVVKPTVLHTFDSTRLNVEVIRSE